MHRMKIVTAALLTCCLGLGTVAMAGGTKKDAAMKGSASSDAMMEAMMKIASPGEYHNYLKPLAGTWKTTVKFWTAPAQTQISEGECESVWVMCDVYLKSERT